MKTLLKKTPRQLFNENVVEEFKKFIKKTPNSVLFWNGLLYFLFFVAWIVVGHECAGIVSGVGSLFYLALILDDNDTDAELHLWPPLTILFWFFIALMLVLGFFYLIYIFTVKPFNDWLDRLKFKKENASDN